MISWSSFNKELAVAVLTVEVRVSHYMISWSSFSGELAVAVLTVEVRVSWKSSSLLLLWKLTETLEV